MTWTAPEPVYRRILYLLLALSLATGYLLYTHQFWLPSHPGVDQNGYLVGGRLLAENGSMALHPGDDPYTFIGRMWVGVDLGTPAERYYPKYPIGLPLVYAGAWIMGGPVLAYWISPVAMSAGLLACYLLLRQVAGTYISLLGTLILATSPVTVALTNNPNSHAATFFCVTWGMVLLFSWWRRGGAGRALLAGLLLGYAATIRYTEALLVLPIGLTILFSMRWTRLRSYLQSALLLICWALPIGLLLWHNQATLGTWTGYDPTRESSGFSLHHVLDNWESMIRQLANTGLFFILPLGLFGLMRMAWWRLRVALVLLSWVVPGALLYTAYYWAPDGAGIGYMRFFHTFFPPLVMGAAWLLERISSATFDGDRAPAPGSLRRFIQRLLAPLPLGVVAGIAVLMGATSAQAHLESGYRSALLSEINSRAVLDNIPDNSVIFSENRVLHHLQFIASHRLYNFEPFTRASLRRLTEVREDAPNPLQAQRAAALVGMLGDKTDQQLIAAQNALVQQALDAGQGVYFVVPQTAFNRTYKRYVTQGFHARTITTWSEPANLQSVTHSRWQGFGPTRRARPARDVSWVLLEITADGP